MIEYVERKGSNCYKWDSDHAAGSLPLWVADMDFKAAPAILEAMQKRLNHGVFGYTQVPKEYYDAITNWFDRRHGWKGISRENTIYTIGIVPGISAILRAVTRPGDKVLTHLPAYNCFLSSIRNLECQLVENHLVCRQDHFEIDWEAFERDIQDCKVFILCNPHNPTGRFWTREELTQMASICEQHHVFVISDEIHCEFAFPGQAYTPFATVATNDYYCVCTAASKAFNIAGLQCANLFVPNGDIYAKIDKAINIHEVCDINPFGMVALMAAYNESEAWIDELNSIIYDNYLLVQKKLQAYSDYSLPLTKMEGTYLAWVNIEDTGMSAEQLCDGLQQAEHVLFNPSEMYGTKGYIRINLATKKENVAEAMDALLRYLSSFTK